MNPQLRHLKKLDEKILQLWVDGEGKLNENSSNLFLVLLEKRVDLLKILRAAGVHLDPETCVPSWLEKFTRNAQCFTVRDLKVALSQTQKELSQ